MNDEYVYLVCLSLLYFSSVAVRQSNAQLAVSLRRFATGHLHRLQALLHSALFAMMMGLLSQPGSNSWNFG